tara:strand:+ start:449 stop:787 length:339 start_codon:yes stop_codon:yes gene_type:complete
MKNSEILIDDFIKIELRVAKVFKAEAVEDADKLVKLYLDVGELGKKQVFAGIKMHYSEDELTGTNVVLVYNLKPRKMRFGVSEGMILASTNKEGKVYLIRPSQDASPGDIVK